MMDMERLLFVWSWPKFFCFFLYSLLEVRLNKCLEVVADYFEETAAPVVLRHLSRLFCSKSDFIFCPTRPESRDTITGLWSQDASMFWATAACCDSKMERKFRGIFSSKSHFLNLCCDVVYLQYRMYTPASFPSFETSFITIFRVAF